jgi:ADP-ribose pyrophosphatase YjhB (NUDIX family)
MVRVCGVLVENDAILLVRHKGMGELGELWIPPGGGVEFGSSLEQNLKREINEETGLNVIVKDFLVGHEYLDPPFHAIELFFEVKRLDGNLIIGNDPELESENQLIDRVEFVTFRQLMVMDNKIKHQILWDISSFKHLLARKGDFILRDK